MIEITKSARSPSTALTRGSGSQASSLEAAKASIERSPIIGLMREHAERVVVPESVVRQLQGVFPYAKPEHIRSNYRLVIAALRTLEIDTPDMRRYALASIAAESCTFRPISEKPSRYSTHPEKLAVMMKQGGKPEFDFSKYEKMERDLGNTESGDGARFAGRGLFQTTGRREYERLAVVSRVDLVSHPELALHPEISALGVATYLFDKRANLEASIERVHTSTKADRMETLKSARRILNGGTHGIDKFIATWNNTERIVRDGALLARE